MPPKLGHVLIWALRRALRAPNYEGRFPVVVCYKRNKKQQPSIGYLNRVYVGINWLRNEWPTEFAQAVLSGQPMEITQAQGLEFSHKPRENALKLPK